MLDGTKAFSGFSIIDEATSQKFYGETLGLDITKDAMGLHLKLGSNEVFVYPKPDHQPASFTILNFPVDNIDEAVDELSGKGVSFEKYEGMHQDDKGIARGKAANMGPDIAWFKDPSGNILSILSH